TLESTHVIRLRIHIPQEPVIQRDRHDSPRTLIIVRYREHSKKPITLVIEADRAIVLALDQRAIIFSFFYSPLFVSIPTLPQHTREDKSQNPTITNSINTPIRASHPLERESSTRVLLIAPERHSDAMRASPAHIAYLS